MEGISAHVYKGIKNYWKHRGYKRLKTDTTHAQPDPISMGPYSDKPKGKRRFFRVKMHRRIRLWKKFVGLPKKLLTRLRDNYVKVMLQIANNGLVLGGRPTGFGGSMDYLYGLGHYRTQIKEYDDKMIVEAYKSLMIAQQHNGNISTAKFRYPQRFRNLHKISISTR